MIFRNIYLVRDGENHWVSATDENDAIYELAKRVYGYSDVNLYKYEMEPDITCLNPEEEVSYYDESNESEVISSCRNLANSFSGVVCSSLW